MKRNGTELDRQRGQALMEYTLLLMMVTMVFWVGIRNSDLSRELARAWSKVHDCVELPMACDSAS
jgi:Flp pilus assembly pilin Flp